MTPAAAAGAVRGRPAVNAMSSRNRAAPISGTGSSTALSPPPEQDAGRVLLSAIG